MTRQAIEANFDGLVGPTHNYAGLSFGNVASMGNAQAASRPREAVKQGIAKMRRLVRAGYAQAALPPHERPHLGTLRALGFTGSDADVLEAAWRVDPALLAQVSSASAMWTANAATVSPSADTADGRVHFSPANLQAKFHRGIEAETTTRVLRAIFADPARFCVHDPLPPSAHLGDEGAANHTRLCVAHGAPGVEVFVYGRRAFSKGPAPTRFPARQTLEASEAIARRHGLDPSRTVFVQQTPSVIDAGVFHNDVISVGHLGVLLVHEDAFPNLSEHLAQLDALLGEGVLRPVVVPRAKVPVEDAVRSYLFNTQLLARGEGVVIVAPRECEEVPSVKAFLDAQVADAASPIEAVEIVDVRQSMRNGGGPACLRLRVALTEEERAATAPGVWMTEARLDALDAWADRHYRETLRDDELRDPQLLIESREALDALSALLGIGSVYAFQRG